MLRSHGFVLSHYNLIAVVATDNVHSCELTRPAHVTPVVAKSSPSHLGTKDRRQAEYQAGNVYISQLQRGAGGGRSSAVGTSGRQFADHCGEIQPGGWTDSRAEVQERPRMASLRSPTRVVAFLRRRRRACSTPSTTRGMPERTPVAVGLGCISCGKSGSGMGSGSRSRVSNARGIAYQTRLAYRLLSREPLSTYGYQTCS